ncbi:hypothetical protein [Nocardioides flavescens]|uniref:Uncharacterized protein n=1 Tax=Nocardioides flavescens TaxID=2691959 RepID=A0A6L7F0Y0_9ACTN|nr:hypothetical protein [Nocardioides flavescens]MXG89862.1 hypothetical protein [Nocardioides flavescens]
MSRWRERLRTLLRRHATAAPPSWAALGAAPLERARPASSALAGLDSAQLCGLWRKSAAGLTAASDVEQHLAVVEARGALLAELERRDPDPMGAWLARGGRGEPAGPAAYLVGADHLPGHRPGRRESDHQETPER